MVAKIVVLPEKVANQIAAGEVIERPANVVKELLENSLDAGATRIDIQFRSGGTSFIRVSDNGRGMDATDAELCFKRHATSKLLHIEDLQSLHSFGFRGEALPSIASVSKIHLCTRAKDQDLGIEIESEAGQIVQKKPCVCPIGTSFTIEQLFYNIPVRRKFLKSEATESAHIVNQVRLYALAYPHVHFTLKQEERLIFSSPCCQQLEARIDELWPKRACKNWLSLNYTQENITFTGLICPPGVGYASSQDIHIFLNKRPIASTFFLSTLRECYRSYLPPKTHPSVFIFLELPENEVDINVHPTKREVRFKHELKLRQVFGEALQKCLQKAAGNNPTTSAQSFSQPISYPTYTNSKDDFKNLDNWVCKQSKAPGGISIHFKQASPQASFIPSKSPFRFTPKTPDTIANQSVKIQLKFFGLWQNTYALFDEKSSLLVLNCKGAQMRIWYDGILKTLKKGSLENLQTLLFPHTFKLDRLQAACLNESIDHLHRRKLCRLQATAEDTFVLEAVPQWLPVEQVDLFVEQLVENLMEFGQNQTLEQVFEPLIKKLLPYKRFETIENQSQVELLRQTLESCENHITDPNGNLLWRKLSLEELFRQ